MRGTIYQLQPNNKTVLYPASFVAVYDIVDVNLMRHYKIKFMTDVIAYQPQTGDILTFENQKTGYYQSNTAISSNTWALVLDTVNDDGTLIFTDIWHSQASQFGVMGTTSWVQVWNDLYGEFFKQTVFFNAMAPTIKLTTPNLPSVFTEFQNKTAADWFTYYINRIGNQCYFTQSQSDLTLYGRAPKIFGMVADGFVTQIEQQSRSKANSGYNLVRGYKSTGELYKYAWLNSQNAITIGTSIPITHNSIRSTAVSVEDGQNQLDDNLKNNAYQALTQSINDNYTNLCVKIDFSNAPNFVGLGIVYVGDFIHVAPNIYLPIREVDFLNGAIIAGTNNDLTLIN